MKKSIAVLMTLMLMLAMTACGGSDDTAAAREDKAGFNHETNETIEIGGYSFEIPDYYVLNEELTGDTNTDYRIADGEAVIRFAADDEIAGNKDEFDTVRDAYIEGVISGVADDSKADGNDFTCTVNGSPCSGRVELLYNEPMHTLVAVIFMQQDASSADYLPDFEKVMASAKLVASESAESSAGEESSDIDSGLLSPEFKKTMDDYEAWFDHYCEVMKKYQEDSSNIELLSEMTDLLSEETEMLEQMENMDQSQMNSAELAYYIEVTARIEKKLLEVADY
ncbi:MAG: hypothetical protein J6D57_14210 [Mogibacterium sp.]|nr:hypothetical protein [Mogibacterium sp.]